MELPANKILCIALASFALLTACKRSVPRNGSGEEWRSWKPEQQQEFVVAYLGGYERGQHALCSYTDFEDAFNKRSHSDPNDPDPCRRPRDVYSHVGSPFDWAAYTAPYVSVINDFYKHPECRVMPYPFLMEHLVDREYMSGEDMFKLLQTGKAHWGSFEVEGMEKCIVPQTPTGNE
jgi:hypothetical protein